MHAFHHIACLLGFLVVPGLGDLQCLKWDLLLNPVGLLCHFKPALYSQFTESVEAAANATRTALNELVHFDLTHHPAAVAYQYVQNAEAGGLQQANQGLANATHDFAQVGIGLGEDLVNTGVQIYNLLDWSDVVSCILTGSAKAHPSYGALPLVASSAFPHDRAALDLWNQCSKTKFSKPLVYNITEPNQKVGATIAEVATMLVPISGPETAGTDAVKLSLGSEGTDVYLRAKSSTTGKFFTNPIESQTVADALKEPEFEKNSCIVCFPPNGATSARRFLRRGTGELGLCCNLPPAPAPAPDTVPSGVEATDDEGYGPEISAEDDETTAQAVHGELVDGPGQGSLDLAPQFVMRRPEVAKDVDGLLEDFKDLASGQIMSKVLSSEFFERVRGIFLRPATDKTYQALKIMRITDEHRLKSSSLYWAHSTDPEIGFLQDFYKKVEDEVLPLTEKLRGYPKEDMTVELQMYYSPPANYEENKIAYLPYHTDDRVVSYGASDTPGLVIKRQNGKAYPVPASTNSWFGFPGMWFAPSKPFKGIVGTPHAVFGPKMAAEGRLSILAVVTPVFQVATP